MGNKLPGHRKTVVIILGPTAVGKTGLSLLLSSALDTEIISADSMQIYRYMDIGTAKPLPDERSGIKHHLVDILSPGDSFSAGMFKKMATVIIDDLHRRGKLPVIVGGTGLYIRTLTQGLFDGPPADWKLREKLMEAEHIAGNGYLYEILKKMDPLSAGRINPNDTRRTVRAVEVLFKTKKTLTESLGISTLSPGYDFVKVGLVRERREHCSLIEKRVDSMMDRGLLRETERFLRMNPGRTPLQAIGYKEIQLYLKGLLNLEESVLLLKRRTKMLAKRQLTWFKKEPDVQWVDVTGITAAREIFDKVLDHVAILRELVYGKKQ